MPASVKIAAREERRDADEGEKFSRAGVIRSLYYPCEK